MLAGPGRGASCKRKPQHGRTPRNPRDRSARWLLNIAYMTLGEHPGKVPARYLIPEEVFVSDYDIGQFRDVAPALGLDVAGLAGGGIMEDFDGDGHLDVFATSWGLCDQVRYFRNGGDGSFSDRTEEAGLLGIVGGLNALQTDYDNDGWADLLVLRGAWLNRPPATDGGRHPNRVPGRGVERGHSAAGMRRATAPPAPAEPAGLVLRPVHRPGGGHPGGKAAAAARYLGA